MKPQWSIKDFADKYGFDAAGAGKKLGGSNDHPQKTMDKQQRIHLGAYSWKTNKVRRYDHDEMLAWLKKHEFIKAK